MKTPVIFLHGAIGTTHHMTNLQNLQWPSYKIDFRGHGKNEMSENLSIPSFSEDVFQFLSSQKLSKINLIGYSMGGYVGLYFAAHYPELVSSVVCIGTKFDWNPLTAEKESFFLNPEKIIVKAPRFAQKLENEHGQKWKHLLVSTAQMLKIMGDNPPT
jgi:pimeloyl-ACP methyl ester carboxylesterase